MSSSALLRCPGSDRTLSPGDARTLREGDVPFLDFLRDETDAELLRQQAIYDSEHSRYARERGDAAFMRAFVADYVEGRVKNKGRLLLDALRRLAPGRGGTLVELGCNDGRFLNAAVALHDCRGLGVDVSVNSIRRAVRARPPSCDTEFHVAKASALPCASESVDGILSFDVFEHLGHQGVRDVLAECHRVLKRGGGIALYIVSRKDRFTLHETFRTVSHGRVGVDQGEGHTYENFVLPDELRRYAADAGLDVVHLKAHHGFWTLFAEEVWANRLPRWAYPVLDLLDRPLVRHEHGNGFLVELTRSAR